MGYNKRKMWSARYLLFEPMTIESDADILIYDRLQCVIDIYQYKTLLNDILLEEEYRVTMYTKLLSHHSLNYLPGTSA